MLRVTVDTNVLDEPRIRRIREAAVGLDVEIAPTTVTLRERPGTSSLIASVAETSVYGEPHNDSRAMYAAPVYETMVLDESPLGFAVLAADNAPILFETILDVISNGSFPKPGMREALSEGERRQLRDAMILEAHARERRDILVTEDDKAFVGKDGQRRRLLEALARTRIMNVDEFVAHADDLRARVC